MSRAMKAGQALRRKLGAAGAVDVEAVAAMVDLEVESYPFSRVEEVTLGRTVVVGHGLSPSWRRWCLGHAIGHRVLHPGNHLWMRQHTRLADRFEREAEEFAWGLLFDEDECHAIGLSEADEIADHSGIPAELLALQGRVWP